MLGPTCEYYGRRISPKSMGFDSALEELSWRLQRNPRQIFQFIKKNISFLTRVRALYREDLYHKALLWGLGFKDNDSRSRGEKNLASVLNKVSQIGVISSAQIHEWALSRFPHVHQASFRNSGFVAVSSGHSDRSYFIIN